MTLNPDFYLACNELATQFEPRECYVKERIRAVGRDDYMVVSISPPLEGHYGQPDLTEVILATRHMGQTLFPIREWPTYVYVCRVKMVLVDSGPLDPRNLEIVLWGELYANYKDATERTDGPNLG